MKGQKKLLDDLSKSHACYVLITCGHPSEDGHMQVDLSYSGDPTLAAYLLEGAQDSLEWEIDQAEPD